MVLKSGTKYLKKSHFTKVHKKCQKWSILSNFWKNYWMLSYSITRQASWNRTKIGGKCPKWKILMRNFQAMWDLLVIFYHYFVPILLTGFIMTPDFPRHVLVVCRVYTKVYSSTFMQMRVFRPLDRWWTTTWSAFRLCLISVFSVSVTTSELSPYNQLPSLWENGVTPFRKTKLYT